MGVRKLSVRSLLVSVGDVVASGIFSFSLSGGVVGCEESGPPPGVGGCRVSVGGGMLVPSVRL